MARLETWYKQDLKRPLIVHKHTDVFNQDSKGNLIGVEVYSDGEPVVLAGSISGYCLLADGTTVPAVGASRSGNKASVLIPQTAYSVPGPITITIKNVEGDNIATLCATVGVVRQSVSGNLVNPGSVVTDWSNNINAQLQAVQTAADNVGAIVAAPFDENTVYVVGNYVTNNGNLYRITKDHAAGVAWVDTAKVQCTVGSELSELKSAIANAFNLSNFEFAWGGIYNDSINTSKTRIHTVKMIWLPKGTKIKTSNTFANISIARYNLDGSYAENGTWVTEYTAPNDCYVRIAMRKPSGEIDESEFAGLISQLSIFYSTTAETFFYDLIKANTKEVNYQKFVRDTYKITNIPESNNTEICNLFDKNAPDISTTGYYDRTNSFVSSGTIGATGLFPVYEGLEYYYSTNAGGYFLWYNANKEFISYTNVSGKNVKATAVLGARYARTNFLIADINVFYVKCDEIYSIGKEKSVYNGLSGVAFGTSLTYRAQTTGGYLQYLPSMSGIEFDNQGLGSSTILPSGSQPQMLPVITGYTGYSGKRVCILEGFVNDWYYNPDKLGTWKDTEQTTVCGCVRYALNYILTQNQNLTVFLVMDHFGKGISAATAVNSDGKTQFEFYQEIEKVALSMGVRVIREYELSEISQLTYQYLLDNIHLNDLGAKQSANAIWGEMKRTFPNEVTA